MIKENSFINTIKEKQNISDRQEWMFRKSFRQMTKAEKKRHDSDYVKEKNRLPFAQWFELIGENISEGNFYYERNKNNISLGGKHDKKRADLNDPEYREYLGLRPLEENELDEIKSRFKKNTDIQYPNLERFDEDEDESEDLLDVTEEISEAIQE